MRAHKKNSDAKIYSTLRECTNTLKYQCIPSSLTRLITKNSQQIIDMFSIYVTVHMGTSYYGLVLSLKGKRHQVLWVSTMSW